MNGRVNGVGRFVGGTILNLAALGGLICLVLVVLAFVLNTSLIMFKTGSMSPTIPAGSLSVVREIPATEIRVGDVVTVDRPAALPITHRVTSVVDGPSSGERVITMKGDANEAEDPFPYTVDSVRIVLFSVPNLAYGVVWLSNPWVLALLTVGASAVVTWAFWPRDSAEEEADRQVASLPLRELPRNGSQPGLALLIAPLALSLAVSGSAPAVTEEITISGHLWVATIGDEVAMAQLAPGEPVQWQVGIGTVNSEPGEVRIELLGNGNAGLGLHATVRACERRWVEGTCAGGADQLQVPGPVAVDGTRRWLTSMPVAEERWLLFDLWLPVGGTPDAAGGHVNLQVHVSGSGDGITTSLGPVGPLAPTGIKPLLALFAAVGSVGLGLALAGAARNLRKWNR